MTGKALTLIAALTCAACSNDFDDFTFTNGADAGAQDEDAGGDVAVVGSFQPLSWHGCVLRNTKGSVPRPALGFQMVTGMLASMHEWANEGADRIWWKQYPNGAVEFYRDANAQGVKYAWARFIFVEAQPLWRSNDPRFELEFWAHECKGYNLGCWERFKVYHKATNGTYATMHPTEMPTLADRDQYTTWEAVDSFPADPAKTYDAMCPGSYTGDPEWY